MTYFIFSVILVLAYITFNFFAEKPEKKSSWAWIIGLALVIGGAFHIANYFIMPTFAYDCWPVYIEMIIFTAFSILFTSMRVSDGDTGLELDNDAIRHTFFGGWIGVALLGLASLYTWDNLHTQFQRNLLEVKDTVDVRTSNGNSAFSPIPVEKMKLKPVEVAKRNVLNMMGDLKNTFELSAFTLQSATIHCDVETYDGKKYRLDYDNQLVYVSILEFKNFWTWKTQKYSPAYVLVDAATGEAYIITKVNGEDIQIRYTHEAAPFSTVGANFSYNLERHLRSNGFASTILDDFNVEIDENGRPFAPVTTLKKVVGMSTPQVTGVAVVDIQTGDIKWYKPQDAPSFVNRIYPEWLVFERIKNWGEYPNGYFHWTNNDGLLQPCEGMDIVQTKTGCCYYVGIQAKTGTFDTEGYMLVDIRTGAATYYKRDGISEAEAINTITNSNYKRGKTEIVMAQQLNDSILHLTEPIFYNIDGRNTFFAMFVANADLTVKYYAFCSADSKGVVGIGENLMQAKAAYNDAYNRHLANKASSKLQTTDKMLVVTLEAEVLEKVAENDAYYLRLKGQEDKIFYTYSNLLPEIRWSSKKVKITYMKTDDKEIAITSYKALD
ncbi:MAG: hypothetical protein IKR92_03535 [Alphaproteobacteria bacterium]|nr:hypothetical protein [Alphaproteobacteria bacterium]